MNRREFFAASAATAVGGVAVAVPAGKSHRRAIDLFRREDFGAEEIVEFPLDFRAWRNGYDTASCRPFIPERDAEMIAKAAERTLIAAAECDSYPKCVGPNPERVRVGDQWVLVGKGAGCVMPVQNGKVTVMVLNSDRVAMERG